MSKDSDASTYTINDMRTDLAATIRALRNNDGNMTVDKAKAIGDLAQVMINSAKVEVDMIRAVGQRGMRPTGFVAIAPPGDTLDEQQRTAGGESPRPTRQHIRNPLGSEPRGALR
ncbi:hypothetical protein [Stenotrophomonas sp. PS02298]|uniref:hypothetical protein n=1 Tax=Stenotrophomonas sp. PS02298 TaxID=2991424 RepID=UPI002499F689|nr:hypothetical protein [Stenotrophomonas sp. PS02298]